MFPRWYGRAKKLCATPEFSIFGLLLLLACVSGQRLEDDSYGHYARSKQQVLNLDLSAWVIDVWNKPIPGLLYGLGSAGGLWGARGVAGLVCVTTLYFTRRLVECWLPLTQRGRWWIAGLLMAQLPLLKDAFVTMTELPAAGFVAVALYALFVDRRPYKAALLAGCTPLCRVEMIPVVAILAIFCCFEEWDRSTVETAWRRWLRVAAPAGICATPFVLWLVAGAVVTGNVHWFSEASYAFIRTNWDLPAALRYNVLTGLVNVLPPPLLLLAVYSVVTWGRSVLGSGSRFGRCLCLLLVVHYGLLNTLVVYPSDWFGVPLGHGVAAINGRNYSSTAPVLLVLLVLGLAAQCGVVSGESPTSARRSSPNERWVNGRLIGSVGFVLTLITLSKGASLAEFALHLGLVGLGVVFFVWMLRLTNQADLSHAECFNRVLRASAVVGLCSSLIIRPFFWYPIPSTDHRQRALTELTQEISRQRPAHVIQDVASFLGVFAAEAGVDLSATKADWTWPGDFARRLTASPPDTWVVFELSPKGELRDRYPAAVLTMIETGHLEPVEQFQTVASPGFLGFLDRLSARNAPIGWRAFRLKNENVAGEGAP